MSEIRLYTDGEQATAETLNRPLGDLHKAGQYMSKAQFEANAEANRNIFAGSGFVEWGANRDGADDNKINEGMFVYKSSKGIYANGINLGRNVGLRPNAIANINGNLLKLSADGQNGIGNDNRILFPNSPTLLGKIGNLKDIDFNIKKGEFFILNDLSSDCHKLHNTNVESAATLTEDNGVYTLSRKDEDGHNAWYHSRGKSYNINTIYNFKLEIIDNPDNKEELYFGMYDCEKQPSSNGYKIIDNFISFNFVVTANSNNGMYINGLEKGESISFKKPVITMVNKNIAIATKDITENSDISDKATSYKIEDSISRQDLVFLESWKENISEKDIVYPYGNIQYKGSNTDGLSGIAEGDFAGKETYSLYGEWQEDNGLVGKGYKWSELGNEDKLKFSGNKENNIYKDGEDIIQVRYRIRVIQGLGNNWNNGAYTVDSQKEEDYTLLGCSPLRVEPKGKNIKVNDLDNNNTFYAYGAKKVNIYEAQNGLFIHNQSKTMALPIALVQRRNDGAFDPVHNPEGCGTFSDGKEWFETEDSHNSLSDCFTNKANGDIESGLSGRPFNEFFNQIANQDIEDLRMSAKKITSINEFINLKVQNYFTGKIRMQENIETFKPIKAKKRNRLIWLGSNNLDIGSEMQIYTNLHNSIKSNVNIWKYNLGSLIRFSLSNGGYIEMLITSKQNENESYRGTITAIDNFTMDNLDNIDSNYYMPKDINFLAPTTHNFKNNDLFVYCDIIGNPTNYPQEWKDNGINGNALIKDDENRSLLPEDVPLETHSKLFKLSRKLNKPYNNTYFDQTSAILIGIKDDGTGEIIPCHVDSTYVNIHGDENIGWYGHNMRNDVRISELALEAYPTILVYYTTKANGSKISSETHMKNSNTYVSAFSEANIYNRFLSNVSSDLINKITMGGNRQPDYNFNIPISLSTSVNNEIIPTGYGGKTYHDIINLGSESFAIKLFHGISETNNLTYLNLIFKEMKWDESIDNDTDFEEIAGDVSASHSKGEKIQVTSGPNKGYWVCVKNIGEYTFDDDRWQEINDNLIWAHNDSAIYFKKWIGNGWGDNGEFENISNIKLSMDDNQKEILEGQKTIKLDHFLNL